MVPPRPECGQGFRGCVYAGIIAWLWASVRPAAAARGISWWVQRGLSRGKDERNNVQAQMHNVWYLGASETHGLLPTPQSRGINVINRWVQCGPMGLRSSVWNPLTPWMPHYREGGGASKRRMRGHSPFILLTRQSISEATYEWLSYSQGASHWGHLKSEVAAGMQAENSLTLWPTATLPCRGWGPLERGPF